MLTLGKAELQAGLETYFPINSDDYIEEELPASLTLSDPELILEEGSDRIGLRVAIAAQKEDAAPELPAPPAGTGDGESPSGAPPDDGGTLELNPPLQDPPGPKPPGPGQPGRLLGANPPLPAPPGNPPVEPPPIDKALPAAPPEEFTGTMTISGKVAYRAEEAAFYFLEPSIDEVAIEQLPPAMDQPVRKAASKVLTKYLTENPVYTLSDEDSKIKAAKMLLKSVAVEDGKLKVELGP